MWEEIKKLYSEPFFFIVDEGGDEEIYSGPFFNKWGERFDLKFEIDVDLKLKAKIWLKLEEILWEILNEGKIVHLKGKIWLKMEQIWVSAWNFYREQFLKTGTRLLHKFFVWLYS